MVGPLSAAIGRAPQTSARMSHGRRNDSTSMPLAMLTIGTAGRSAGAMRAKVGRMNWVGIAQTTSVASDRHAGSEVTRSASGTRKPGRRSLVRVDAIRAAASANGETIVVAMPRVASTSVRTRAIWPSPTIATCSGSDCTGAG